MQVNRVQAQNYSNYSMNNSNKKVSNQAKSNDLAFKATYVQVADDSFGPLVIKTVSNFMGFMQNLFDKAIAGDSKAKNYATQLVGEKTTNAIIADKVAYTEKTDKLATKTLPASGEGSRGAQLRKLIAEALGIKGLDKEGNLATGTSKSAMPLAAKIGDTQDGEPIHATTITNELLHMMEAGTLSPYEKLDFINTKTSDGDITVIIEGLKQKLIPTDRPVLFSYTDDITTEGYKDYAALIKKAQSLGADSNTEILVRGNMDTKEAAAGKLGTYIPNGDGSFRVIEKPSMEVLNKELPDSDMVATNIGKTLIMPKGLKEIQGRIQAVNGDVNAPNNTLIKMDKGKQKWHMTEGVLKPAGERGALDVSEKWERFSDVGNGPIFTDMMLEVANGKFSKVFPEPIEAQIRNNVKLSPDGLSATFDYGDGKIVTLPTIKGDELAKATAEAAKAGA